MFAVITRWLFRVNESITLLQGILAELKKSHPEINITPKETPIDQTASFM
jgi:hypothetical protein